MIAVLFEARVRPDGTQAYLDIAAALRPELERIDGFVSVERFRSLSDEGKLLSLSFFRDEEAVAAWRNLPRHRGAQSRGRSGLFEDYRLRIAHVVRDYGLSDRAQAPNDSRSAHDRGDSSGR
jgi:heme-degrading monooxygenase HmoA